MTCAMLFCSVIEMTIWKGVTQFFSSEMTRLLTFKYNGDNILNKRLYFVDPNMENMYYLMSLLCLIFVYQEFQLLFL